MLVPLITPKCDALRHAVGRFVEQAISDGATFRLRLVAVVQRWPTNSRARRLAGGWFGANSVTVATGRALHCFTVLLVVPGPAA